MMTRPRVRQAVLVIAFGFAAVFINPAPASALGTCGPGSSVLNAAYCVDAASGKVSGRLDLTRPPSVPQYRTALPSSVIASGEGAATTVLEGEGLALMDTAGGTAVVAAGETGFLASALANPAGVIIAGGLTGYSVGGGIAHVSCALGVDLLCNPNDQKTPGYTPNGDVGPDSAGWVCPTGCAWTGTNFGVNPVTPGTVALDPPTIDPNVFTYGWSEYSDGYTKRTDETHGVTAHAAVTAAGDSPNDVRISVTLIEFCKTTSGAIREGGYVNYYTSGINTNGSFTFGQGGIPWAAGGSSYICTQATSLDRFDHLVLTAIGGQGGVWSPTSSPDATWYPPGHQARPTSVTNPNRQLRMTYTCHPATGADTLSSRSSASFHESDPLPTSYPQPAACPTTAPLASWILEEVATDGSVPNRTLRTWTAPAALTAWRVNHPECSDGHCRLGLWKTAGTDHLNCRTESTDCAKWFSDPNKTADYQCSYGDGGDTIYNAANDVGIAECNVLSPTFDPVKIATGASPVGDPKTGADVPLTDPSTTTSPAGTPVPGGADGSCWPSGWSEVFNPASWVLKPVECAMVWAFVPDSATVTGLRSTVGTAVDTSGVGPWISVFGGLLPGVPSGGCQGPNVALPMIPGDQSFFPFSACAEPVSTVATISRAVTTIGIIIGGGWACMGALTSAFGYRDD